MGFVVITGEVGTGKTTLLRTLQAHLDDQVKTANIFYTKTTFRELLKNVLLEFELPVTDDDTFLLIDRLSRYLVERSMKGDIVTLIIDEAQNLSEDVLEEIRLLSNLETQRSKLLQIVLVGQPELETKLHSEGLRQLKQRIGVQRRIKPLGEKECLDYIEHRVRMVGGEPSKLFTPEAMRLIAQRTKGIPRLINAICHNALLTGYSLSRKRIDADIVHQVFRDMNGDSAGEAPVEEPVATCRTPERPVTRIEMLRKLLRTVTTRKEAT
jgi:general secretion pathway protein A